MSAKDKALDLYFKYEKEIRIYRQNGFEYDGRKAKNCCLITVDEILKAVDSDWSFMQKRIDYWNDVKTEIQKL
jgi:hypothetical protein